MNIFQKSLHAGIALVVTLFVARDASAQWAPPDKLLLHTINTTDTGSTTDGFIVIPNATTQNGIVVLLSFIQELLVKVALPLVAVGCGLYIAYLLFTAEGDESKMKKVWTAVTYSAIGIIAIMLSYFIVDLISRAHIA